jgi:hypothetical protein
MFIENVERTSNRQGPRDLAVVRFQHVTGATRAFAHALDLAGPEAAWIRQAGLVEHHSNGHWVVHGVFDGHYLDIDEALHMSERGAAEGGLAGAALGALIGPPGLAAGLILGAVIGSQAHPAGEHDPEPAGLMAELEDDLPSPGSAIALIAGADLVDQMLSALGAPDVDTFRRRLTPAETEALEISLIGMPAAASPP